MTIEQIVARAPVPWDALNEIDNIMTDRIRAIDRLPVKNMNSYFRWIALGCYVYGVMADKRAERARRKAKEARHESV